MAVKRMFSKKVIDEDNFIDMPVSARLLYFDLCLRADDDGFISPKRVIRMTGASDDDLKILVAKEYLLPFESGVVVVRHWRIHNTLAKDRYAETTYSSEKETLEIVNNMYVYKLYTECLQDDNKMITQVRLGKSSIDKSSIDKSSCCSVEEKDKITTTDHNFIIEQFNNICFDLQKCIKLTSNRKKAIDNILEQYVLDDIFSVFEKAQSSNFLTGRNSKYKTDFDWLIKPVNFLDILEGKYSADHNQNNNKKGFHNFKQRDINYNELEQERRRKENAEKVVTT